MNEVTAAARGRRVVTGSVASARRIPRWPTFRRRLWVGLAVVLMVLPGVRVARAQQSHGAGPLELHYYLRLLRPTTHILNVEIDVARVSGPFLDFVLPAWAPGRYAIYNFAKNIQQFEAAGAQGEALPWVNVDKQTWRVDTRGASGQVRVTYRVYANNLTGSFSQFDATHANINGASVYMYVAGHKGDPLGLTVNPPPEWGSVVKVIDGFTLSTADRDFRVLNYDRLVDTPMEISTHCQVATFQDHGKTFRVAVHAYNSQGAVVAEPMSRLVQGIKKVVRAEMGMMPDPDFDAYTFIFHFSPYINLGDGMEHLNSTEIMIRNELTDSAAIDAIQTAAHEFFHLWNVKRLRPKGLGPFDYTREVYTRSLWLAEGVTTYFGYWNLLRAGVWDRKRFLAQLAKEIQHFQAEPGKGLMSAESSSFHAWFYDRAPQMQETNFANATISYYNKGALLGMLLDLEVRSRTGGRKSLADVMRYLYHECYQAPPATYYGPGRGYTEDDVLSALNAVAGSDFSKFFQAFVRGTEPLPYDDTLKLAGLTLARTLAPGAPPSMGLRVESTDLGEKIVSMVPGGAADRAGLSRDDVLIAVDELSLATTSLEDRLKMYPAGAVVPFTVQRYGERLRIWVKLDPPSTWQYSIKENPKASAEEIKIREAWLNGELGEGTVTP